MKAARVVAAPGGGHLEILELPVPQPGPGQVLVKVMASGLNRGEINIVRRAVSGPHLPAGVEFAGTVAALGDGVTGWKVGDRVVGHGNGGQAEYTVAAAGALLALPASVGWIAAAAFPNVAITAHDALVTNGAMLTGARVLVNAASSGIGLAAMYIARALGASLIVGTTRSPAKVAPLQALGFEHILDVSQEGARQRVADLTEGKGVDIVIDSVGAPAFAENLDMLAIKGRLVNIGRMGGALAEIDLEKLWLKRLHLIGVTFRTRTEAERIACIQDCGRDLLPHLAAGRLDLPVDTVYPLEQIGAAHAYMAKDRHVGKIVIAVDPAAAAGA